VASSRIRQIKPDQLLHATRSLIEHHEAQGRPKQAYLRRSVSTAYYALFHYLCWETACHLLPDGDAAERLGLVRSIDHSAFKRVCEWIANPKNAPPNVRLMVSALASTEGILNVALAFPDLQQARHDADYNHMIGFSKPAAIELVDAAELAIQSMKYQKKLKRQKFYTLVAMEIKKVQ
jgi:uncharacterized protein (UPF0332 family)